MPRPNGSASCNNRDSPRCRIIFFYRWAVKCLSHRWVSRRRSRRILQKYIAPVTSDVYGQSRSVTRSALLSTSSLCFAAGGFFGDINLGLLGYAGLLHGATEFGRGDKAFGIRRSIPLEEQA